jgi:hypothetical protein
MILTFGDPILPEEIGHFEDDTQALGRFLKARTYALGRI